MRGGRFIDGLVVGGVLGRGALAGRVSIRYDVGLRA